MKQLKIIPVLLLLILAAAQAVTAQKANLVVFTDRPGLKFQVYLNGKKQNNFYVSRQELTELEPQAYKVRVHFEGNNLADVTKEVTLAADTEKTLTFEEIPPLKRKFRRMGRNIGNKLNKEEGSMLREIYELKVLSEKPLKE